MSPAAAAALSNAASRLPSSDAMAAWIVRWSAKVFTSKLGLEGESESFFRRFGDGSSGEEGEVIVGELAAALCMNFIVNSLEDIDLGAPLLGESVDIVQRCRRS